MGFPGSANSIEPTCQCRRHKRCRFHPLGREDPREESMATYSSILAWRIPWTEEPDGPQSIASQEVRCDWRSLAAMHLPCTSITTLCTFPGSSFSLSSVLFLNVAQCSTERRQAHCLQVWDIMRDLITIRIFLLFLRKNTFKICSFDNENFWIISFKGEPSSSVRQNLYWYGKFKYTKNNNNLKSSCPLSALTKTELTYLCDVVKVLSRLKGHCHILPLSSISLSWKWDTRQFTRTGFNESQYLKAVNWVLSFTYVLVLQLLCFI